MRIGRLLLLVFGGLCTAQDVSKLPEWAQEVARAAVQEPAPAGADAWVLLERMHVGYRGAGELSVRRQRLVKVLTEAGIGHTGYSMAGITGATKVERLKGWNIRVDGQVQRLEKEDTALLSQSRGDALTTENITIAMVPRVANGSVVAYESVESITYPMGPAHSSHVMGALPIFRWEFHCAKEEGVFTRLPDVSLVLEPRHLSPLLREVQVDPGKSVVALRVPALPKDEAGWPTKRPFLPEVRIRALDPGHRIGWNLRDWDGLARSVASDVLARAKATGAANLKGKTPAQGLAELHAWMAKDLAYKQVYLTPERGWLPEWPQETFRKRYGDCKDLACFALAEVAELGLRGYPVLARVSDGIVEEDEGASPYLFNHLIVAFRLDKSMAFPAEVETRKGRFLITDPTDTLTPLGSLSAVYSGQRVLICTPEGAEWVTIPDGAIPKSSREIVLKGQVDSQGSLSATLIWRELGCAGPLHAYVAREGTRRLREHLLSDWLDLPPQASLEVMRVGDPKIINQPFELELKLVRPGALKMVGSEIFLELPAFPQPPGRIQRPGRPRILPVQLGPMNPISYKAELTLDRPLFPLLPERVLDTPIRKASWKASVTQVGESARLQLVLDMTRPLVLYAYDEREKGVKDAKADRTACAEFLDMARTFRRTP